MHTSHIDHMAVLHNIMYPIDLCVCILQAQTHTMHALHTYTTHTHMHQYTHAHTHTSSPSLPSPFFFSRETEGEVALGGLQVCAQDPLLSLQQETQCAPCYISGTMHVHTYIHTCVSGLHVRICTCTYATYVYTVCVHVHAYVRTYSVISCAMYVHVRTYVHTLQESSSPRASPQWPHGQLCNLRQTMLCCPVSAASLCGNDSLIACDTVRRPTSKVHV